MSKTEYLKKILDAHGGEDYWRSLEAVEATISVQGLLFTMKRIPVLNHKRVRAEIWQPRFSFLDFPRPGQSGEFIGDEEVHIEDSSGNIVEQRLQPRSAFSSPRRMIYWDSLDFLYFGGYATWNYLITPFLFLRGGFTFEELEPVQGSFGTWTRLRATFPDDIPTHCRTQTFYFDEQSLLRRLDYTAGVIGSWAHAAHLCDKYRVFGGLKVPTRRRVVPTISGDRALPGPTLVAIDVHELRPVSK